VYVLNVFICFRCMLQVFLSRCCKSRSGCYICLHFVNICFKCFQVLHTYVCKCFIWMLHMFAMVFKIFLGIFASVSNACFKCFICLLLYAATDTSGCFKNRSSVAYEMRVGSGGGARDPHAPSGSAGDIRAAWAPRGRAKRWRGRRRARSSAGRGVQARARETKCSVTRHSTV